TRYYDIAPLREKRERIGLSPAEETKLAALEARMEIRLDIMRRMLEFGMKDRIVPGTDSGVQNFAFGHLDYDLQILTQIGFTPSEALISATKTSAEAIGMSDQIGTLEVGKIADLVALDGDPSKDIGVCSRIRAVFLEGTQVS
ncbi:MAG: amidohydrolase family protein, partial [Candidatus Latescibacteria bacterium]|nr:amidohydrolase family protein [Candidatus Latescibacterota bacterium]